VLLTGQSEKLKLPESELSLTFISPYCGPCSVGSDLDAHFLFKSSITNFTARHCL